MDAAVALIADHGAAPLAWQGWEGPRPRLVFGPGMVQFTRADAAKRERTAAREQEAQPKNARALASWLIEGQREGETEETYRARMARVFGDTPMTERSITEWSRKSRANMIRTLSALDWAPLFCGFALPAMTTLTYPGDWLLVAPDGATSKGHLETFFKRFERAWGAEWVGVWKFEFQHRGAPHFHLLSVPPAGAAGEAAYNVRMAAYKRGETARRPRRRQVENHGLGYKAWLSATWTDIVFAAIEEDMAAVEAETGEPDPRREHVMEQRARHLRAGTGVDYQEGAKAYDPKRLAVYFAKHGSFKAKEYQHIVPEPWQEPGKGPGRFWGYRGVEKLVREVELSPADYQFMARTVRRLRSRVRVWDPKTRTNRWVKATRVVEVARYADGVRPAYSGYSEVIGLAGTQYMDSVKESWRRVRRPSQRLSRSAGFVVENNAPQLVETLTRALLACRGAEVEANRSEHVRQVVRERRLNRAEEIRSSRTLQEWDRIRQARADVLQEAY